MPTREENLKMWDQTFDWSRRGEEWTVGEAWWQGILDATVRRYARAGQRMLEIGPGGGRFTAELLAAGPRSLALLDLSPKCLEMCRERFGDRDGSIRYLLGDGTSVPIEEDGSIDLVFSFDVFVHVERPEVLGYFRDFARLLAPGGHGVVHYASVDRAPTGRDPFSGWRARFRSDDMREILAMTGLELVDDIYDPEISHANSSIVVFRRP
ncbi:MAG: class I SAM-dependent methyltransferase [Planctomycetota bacterium]